MKYFFLIMMLFLIACEKTGTDSVKTLTELMSPSGESTSDSSTDTTAMTDTGDAKTNEFMRLINAHRISIGLKALTHDPDIGDIATEHSEDMANGTITFGHGGFSNRCSEGRLAIGGGNLCAENVAMGQKTPQAAFTAWLNSPGHRANMENSRVTHTGFGYAQSSSGTWYWTQIFIEQN